MLLVFFLVLIFTLPLFGQSVDTAWVRRYSSGEGIDLAVDQSDNVYVTGSSKTIKYDPLGNLLWDANQSGIRIVVDDSGHAYTTGGGYWAVKYNSAGGIEWEDYAGGDDPRAITSDKHGNIYVTGITVAFDPRGDISTIKYYPNGDTAWKRAYDGPGHNGDGSTVIAVDAQGNVYVAGWATGLTADYVTVKYDSSGNQLWAKTYDGLGHWNDLITAIAVNSSGLIYVTGTSYGSKASLDCVTIKYLPNGDTVWIRSYDGPGNSYDEAHALSLDRSGNIFVAGGSYGQGTLFDYTVIKYYPNGDTAWVRRYNGPGNDYDIVFAMKVDSYGNVYVTGQSEGSQSRFDYATIKYNQYGDEEWLSRYSGITNRGGGWAEALVLDGSGNVYVTGISADSSGAVYATIKYVQTPAPFRRGDANHDDQISVSDIIYIINYLFRQGLLPYPLEAGDVNCDGNVTVSDVIFLINYLFKGGPAPSC